MSSPEFSIIIPAFNSEKYISKALESIKSQAYKDYELIIVCDSCKDRTAEIARKYTDNVFEVNYGNDGPTRNYGIEQAKGNYILFMDDDDWFLHEYVLNIIAFTLKQENYPDILAFGFIWKNVGYCQNVPGKMYIATWNKCWRRGFVGNTRFSNRYMASDEDFHNAMLSKNPRIVCLCMPMYYYNYMREGSQTYQDTIKKRNGGK